MMNDSKKWFGSDLQDTLQPNRPGTVRTFYKARAKKIIIKTASSIWDAPKKKGQFCMQGC